MKLTDRVLRAPVVAKTAPPEAAKSLEEAWLRRRRELAGWQPGSGWLLDSRTAPKRNGTR